MPHPLAPVATSLVGVATDTALSEGLKSPKAIALFYANVASLKGVNKLETSLIGG